jgi:hypothetical protein
VNAIETVFCAVLPLNRVAEGDVIVYACVNGPREPVVLTSNEPAVPAGIGTLLVIVMGMPEVGVRVKLKRTEYVTEGLRSVPVNSREKLEHVYCSGSSRYHVRIARYSKCHQQHC